jgi:hypothetical protein
MKQWQADFYRRPLRDELGSPLWELVVCSPDGQFTEQAFCSQSQANSHWLTEQLQRLSHLELPDRIQVFRPQSLSLLQAACQPLNIVVEPTRRTPALKQVLQQRAHQYSTLPHYTGQSYDPLLLDRPAPLPLPESLWGDRWQFGSIAAQDFIPAFQHRPIPVRETPEWLDPVHLQLPSTTAIPGVVIEGGRQSMMLARWLQQAKPVALNAVAGDPHGLILEAGLVDRWVLATFQDAEVIEAARTFRDRQQAAQGLHFLLIQPDDSGRTETGLWLLQSEM